MRPFKSIPSRANGAARPGAERPRVLVVTAGAPDKKSFLADAFREACGADVIAAKFRPERRVDGMLARVGIGRIAENARILNREIIARSAKPYDVVCVIKGLSVWRETLDALKANLPSARVILWTCDDQYLPHNQSSAFLDAAPAYDIAFTCKSHNLRNKELEELGFRQVEFLYQAYSEADHLPLPLESSPYRGQVVFIGYAERKRFDFMNHLACNGVEVHVFGTGWDKRGYRGRAHPNLKLHMTPLTGRDYAEALSNAAVSLCFLRELNRDLHTSRTFEIPACGGFMLAERTEEHTELFVEGEEAEFFDSPEELLLKVRRYLADPARRDAIARRGYERTRASRYSYQAMVERIMQVTLGDTQGSVP